MNSLRATPFTDSAQSRLHLATDWPRLPETIVLDRVIGVAINSRGMVYIAHRGDHPLLCLHPDGRLHGEVGAAHQMKSVAYDLRGPVPVPIATRYWLHGLHIDPWDNVWITDVSRHLVMKFSPGGELLMTLGEDGKSGCDEKHFFQPTHVCVVPSGDFFVTDGYGNSRIVKFDPQGNRILEWGARGSAPGEFHTPHVITLGLDGLLYMTDRENDRIQVFDQQGKLKMVWPDLHSVDGLYAAPDGFIYGSAGIDNALLRFDYAGQLLDVWAEPGMLLYPHAITTDQTGAIYAAESGDRWVVTGRLPSERHAIDRTGPEGSRISKLIPRPKP